MIGTYELNGIEPYAQMLKDAILRKSFKQQCINYFGKNFSLKTLILLFSEKGSFGEKKNIFFFMKKKFVISKMKSFRKLLLSFIFKEKNSFEQVKFAMGNKFFFFLRKKFLKRDFFFFFFEEGSHCLEEPKNIKVF